MGKAKNKPKGKPRRRHTVTRPTPPPPEGLEREALLLTQALAQGAQRTMQIVESGHLRVGLSGKQTVFESFKIARMFIRAAPDVETRMRYAAAIIGGVAGGMFDCPEGLPGDPDETLASIFMTAIEAERESREGKRDGDGGGDGDGA